jgi:hypothetical protein
MSLCYEVVTETVNVIEDSGTVGPQEFRVTVPAGKVPLSAGWNGQSAKQIMGSYPDGNDWVFILLGLDVTGGYNVDLYVVCV